MYVKPYVKRGKSDAIDAEAICEAVTRPTMRFVAVKTVEQQSLLSLHRARGLLVRQRTQLINGLRGLVTEFGVYIPKGLARVISFAEDITLGEVLDLPDIANEVIHNLCEHLMALHKRVRWYEERLKQVAKEDERVRLLRTILGVGSVQRRWRARHDLIAQHQSERGRPHRTRFVDKAENVCCAIKRVPKRGSPLPIRHMHAAMSHEASPRLRREA